MWSVGTTEIETDRLVLRRFVEGDIKQVYFNFGGDPLVNRYISFSPCSTITGARAFILDHLKIYDINADFYSWAITLEGQIIGYISLFDVDVDSESAELGYSIGSRWWGQGYATEAAEAVLDFAFLTVRMHRVQATYHPDNIASKRVLEKVGMRFEGIQREAQRNSDGTYSDLCMCSVLSSEYVDHRR